METALQSVMLLTIVVLALSYPAHKVPALVLVRVLAWDQRRLQK